jgi:hypothetical protein
MYYSFVMKLEALLKPVMLMQLLVSMIAFCVIGFQMSMVSLIITQHNKFSLLFDSMYEISDF